MHKIKYTFAIALVWILSFSFCAGQTSHNLFNADQNSSIVFDSHCNMYVGVMLGHSNQVVKIDAVTGVQTVFAGSTFGFSGDGGPATSAKLGALLYLAIDPADHLYIGDTNNGVVWKVDGSGNIHIIAGTGTIGYSGDGGAATSAKIDVSFSISINPVSGYLYIADGDDNAIRVVNSSGVINRFAGNSSHTSGFGGDGGLATDADLYRPEYVDCDAIGNVYIGDNSNGRIRKVTTGGYISTIAGGGTGSLASLPALATSVAGDGFWGLAIDRSVTPNILWVPLKTKMKIF